ncbi:fimbrial protein [Trinickia sp. YCB016]
MSFVTSKSGFSVWIARVLRGLVVGLMALVAQQAVAGKCRYASDNFYGNGSGTIKIPLLVGNLTAGRDLPVGSVLHRQTLSINNGPLAIGCDGDLYDVQLTRTLTIKPQALSTWNGSPYAGSVYETGIPGIGIVVVGPTGTALPYTSSFTNCGGGAGCVWALDAIAAAGFYLIKIGDIGTGTINGNDLPSFQYSFGAGADNTLVLYNASFQGSISVTAQTCQTPNVNVDLGTNKLNDMATVGSGSPWKTFSIALNNCPAFRGTYTGSSSNTTPVFYNNDARNTPSPDRPNSITFQLDPATAVVDRANGVIALSGTNAATGVGIQIARAGTTTGVQYGTLLPSNLTLNTSATGNYTIPLQARYYRTNATARPGSGNAAVTFTLNYQ